MVVTIVEDARTCIGLRGLGDVNCESVSMCDCVCACGGGGDGASPHNPPPALHSPPHTHQNSHGTRQGGEGV
jgi:hypothetical protein